MAEMGELACSGTCSETYPRDDLIPQDSGALMCPDCAATEPPRLLHPPVTEMGSRGGPDEAAHRGGKGAAGESHDAA
jgi:hypothetical protein